MRAVTSGTIRASAVALWAAASAASQSGDHDHAVRLASEARALAGQYGDPTVMARSVLYIAIVAMYRGDFAGAAAVLTEELARSGGSDELAAPEAVSAVLVASTCRRCGDQRRPVDLMDAAPALLHGNTGDGPSSRRTSVGDEGWALLTRREREVAELVAHGLRNKQIAANLFITQRTVAAHVEHILAKLGFTSRTQVAAWFSTLRVTQQSSERPLTE
jgi:DNA-binding CsgD family transcriptional regulator